MSPNHQPALSTRQLLRMLPCLFGSLVLATAAHAAHPLPQSTNVSAQYAAAAPKSYRIIPLRAGGLSGYSGFNSTDQIAVSFNDENGGSSAYFYDGTSLRPIGNSGDTNVVVSGLNDAGEVAGTYRASNGTLRAFKWSRQAGMRELGSLSGTGESNAGFARPINNHGQVVGMSSTQGGPPQAFLWNPTSGLRNLGGLPGNPSGFSVAHAINNVGMVAGHGNAADGTQRAFVWTASTGMTDLGTLGGPVVAAAGLTDAGVVAGGASTADLRYHIFVWTRSGGMRDVGTAGGIESYTSEKPMSSNGHVAGFVRFADDTAHAAVWTRATGLRDLGTLGGHVSTSGGVNKNVHVVGTADINAQERAGFIWTARDGMINLNKRLHKAPAGLVVTYGLSISDNGVIFASTNAGFVLLKPHCGTGS